MRRGQDRRDLIVSARDLDARSELRRGHASDTVEQPQTLGPGAEIAARIQEGAFYSLEAPEKAAIKGEGKVLRIVFMIVGGVIITFGLVAFGKNVGDNVLSGKEESLLES